MENFINPISQNSIPQTYIACTCTCICMYIILLTLILLFSHSQVGCTLDYWEEDCGVFSVLEEFRLSETTPTEVLVSRLVGSCKWRIAVVEVEWEDDEEGERFVGRLVTTLLSFIAYFLSSLSLFHSLIILQTFSAPDFRADLVDEGGSPVPLASILSPVSLAGCTCVDSTFSPQFVPVSDFSLTCHSMQVTLIHITPSNPGSVQLKYQSSYRNSVELLLSLSSCIES